MTAALAEFHSACGGEHFSGFGFDAEASPEVGQPAGNDDAGGPGGSGGGMPGPTGGSGGAGSGGAQGTGGMDATTDAEASGGAGGAGAMDSGTGQMNDAPATSHPATLTGAHPTMLAGNAANGTSNQDSCPPGQALIGFSGSLNMANPSTAVLRQITGQCGVLAIDGTTVIVDAGATLTTRGQPGVSAWARTCPANQVVTGFSGRTGSLIDQLVFICAPLTASSAAVGTALMTGAELSLAAAGGGGGTAFDAIRCDAGEIGSGVVVRTTTEMSGFALVCTKVAIAPQP
ncbi:MAG TPA: hypothetical protein VMU50_19240 [Polyangia bacterium]|nr:hypothetical protein [Polyangia bacterium]